MSLFVVRIPGVKNVDTRSRRVANGAEGYFA